MAKAVLATTISFHKALGTSPYQFKYGCTYPLQIDHTHKVDQKTFSAPTLVRNKNKAFKKYAIKDIQKGKIQNRTRFEKETEYSCIEQMTQIN